MGIVETTLTFAASTREETIHTRGDYTHERRLSTREETIHTRGDTLSQHTHSTYICIYIWREAQRGTTSPSHSESHTNIRREALRGARHLRTFTLYTYTHEKKPH